MLFILMLSLMFCVELNAQTADRESIAQFDRIPARYLEDARNLRVLFMDRSVGANTDGALNCLSASSYGQARPPCRREMREIDGVWQYVLHFTNPSDPYIAFTPSPSTYNRSNWKFYIFADDWEPMVKDFAEGLHNGAIPAQTVLGSPVTVNPDDYDILSFQFSYLNVQPGSTINQFFTVRPGQHDDAYDLEREIEEHVTPRGAKFVYWTASLARSIGAQESEDFNNLLRLWAQMHGRPLYDFADVEATNPDGAPCYDNRDGVPFSFGRQEENYPDDGLNLSAICQNKTPEANGGHIPVAHGQLGAAKSFWVLVAKLAGWSP